MLETLERAAPDATLNDIKALLARMMFSGKAMHKKARSAPQQSGSTRSKAATAPLEYRSSPTTRKFTSWAASPSPHCKGNWLAIVLLGLVHPRRASQRRPVMLPYEKLSPPVSAQLSTSSILDRPHVLGLSGLVCGRRWRC